MWQIDNLILKYYYKGSDKQKYEKKCSKHPEHMSYSHNFIYREDLENFTVLYICI